MDSRSQREFIDRIRREKFGIGATKSNPLAKMLHEAIVSLSAELYQKDIHFISELLQNAEDNVYGKGVTPSLELVLTRADIAGVGAPATLILFNNEVGFQPEHVEALCAVGMSTKKGRRNSGYIGEKGIGFKSVFLVTQTPYVISNGYRFRFTEEANNEANIGYVVPEWIEEPTDADLRRVYGDQKKLPQTVIILPLRPDKVEPVREQLKQVSPETLLFLSKLRQLDVRQDSGNNLCITRSDSVPPSRMGEQCKVATVNLTVGSHINHISEKSTYHLLQQQFPVTQRVEQRKEVENWHITVAFPLSNRINPGRFNGDIYAFLPSDLASGLPFVVNADFLLVSSRETLKFDSPWNIGILSCLPTVFVTAFNFFLRNSDATNAAQANVLAMTARQAYRYIPVQSPQHTEFRNVQRGILDRLKQDDCVLVDSLVGCNMFCKPEMGRLILPDFRRILIATNGEGDLNPLIRNSPWRIVDGEVQKSYASTLKVLGVSDMTEAEYIEYVKQEDWLLNLSEEMYWEVVFFVLNNCMASTSSRMRTVPILKYHQQDGSLALASVQEATSDKGEKIYFSPSEKDECLSKWASVFRPWVSVLFMPTSTVQTLRELQRKAGQNVCAHLYSVVSDLSVKTYLQQLLAILPTSNDPTFIVLTTEFMYQALQGKYIEMTDCYNKHLPVVDQHARVWRVNRCYPCNTSILLPAHGSMWTQLNLNSWSGDIVVMSDDYISNPSGWPSKFKGYICNKEDPIVLESYRSFLRTVADASDIPHFTPPAGSQYAMPTHLKSNMTIAQVSLLLNWLTNVLRRLTVLDISRSHFVQDIIGTEWLPTEAHGLRRPPSCFERSSFGALLKSSDVPCVDPSLGSFSSALESLGVVTDTTKGCDAVVNYMLEMSNDTTGTHSCDLPQAVRLYTYLHMFQWKPGSQKLKIFVPRISQESSNSWKDKDSCVIYNADGFFDCSLTVLENLYPRNLLPFFSEVLQVPVQATVEKYCQLWLKWRTDVHEITVDECTRVWKILSEKWTQCDATVRSYFAANAWVPSNQPSKSEASGTFQLAPPRGCLIPDDLHLLSLFAARPNVHFVWYPNNTEKMESAMNKVYAAMGVTSLSLSVQQEFLVDENSGGSFCIQSQPAVGVEGIFCPGLLRTILGFLARKKYGLQSSERHLLLSSLKSVVQITITRPLSSSYRISSLSPHAVVEEDNVMALWSRKDKKFYCLEKESPILRSSLDRRKFRTQLATAISYGLLSDHAAIADELTEFLIVLMSSGYELSHVEYELKRKNAKLFEEDEVFLSQLLT